jgi:hypothetical protein
MNRRRQARRQIAARRHHPLAVAGYAGSIWLAAAAWALVTERVVPGGLAAFGAASGWSIGPVFALAPALLGGFGYAVGLSWSAAARPLPARAQLRIAALGGLWFTLVLGLLVPLFATMQAGLWPAAVWCVAGSAALAAWHAARVGRRAPASRRRRLLAA